MSSAAARPSSLTAHVLSLVSSASPRDARAASAPTRVDGADEEEQTSWEERLRRWEVEDGTSEDEGLSEEEEATPLPSLLDHYRPSTSAHDAAQPPPSASISSQAPPFAPAHPRPLSPRLASLSGRLSALLPSDSLQASLGALLAPRGGNGTAGQEDLEAQLVELLGFEPEALEVCGEVLGLNEADRRILGEAVGGTSSHPAPHGPSASGTSTPRSTHASHHHGQVHLNLTAGPLAHGNALAGLTQEEADARIEAQLAENAARPLFSGTGYAEQKETYPHVYTSAATNGPASYGGRIALPLGTIRKENEVAQEVIIPPATPVPPKLSERLVPVRELGPLAAGCFPGYTTLNRIQSIVQPTAMGSNENMLICAPTGAGKTDVAIMSILRVLEQNIRPHAVPPYGIHTIALSAFKVIYVAPMKALAAEITRKIGRRLAWLGVKVRELTGDMQLTRQEIAETQVIITTPEKWDVVTRKPTGEGELASKVRLLIIDEIHLLNEERGAVIETIVARTLRQVESSQSLIRIVGLSATLPNYVDVSDFLRVNRYQGLFYFDSSFRPVPLEQRFIGVRGKVRSETSKKNMDTVVFEKVSEMLAQGHQVMVFVHARRETVKTAEKLKEMAMTEGATDDFDPRNHPQFDFFRREIGTSRNKEMKQLFDYGFGIHHAGMLRSDRNMMEKMFEANCIKVLCCTATLAWGVNLPAHAVVIKGTQVYDAGRGSFVDLSILDVLQIFGRAGRPGYESSGVGFICTTQDKLDHYLDAVLSQHPIESKFVPGMVDSLNAEVSLGTIRNMQEAIEWIGYTYLFVRMKRNPFNYGMKHDETMDDPQLGNKREALVHAAAALLNRLQMIKYDEIATAFFITDLGRIAAKYYLKHETVEIFNQHFKAKMTEADCLALLSMSTEFDQIQVRENEIEELRNLMHNVIPCQVKGGTDTTQGKTNILLQAFICKAPIEDFALVSDTAYVAQNAARIIRALLEVALSKKWASAAAVLASMSKSVEKRMWSYENPLRQTRLQPLVLHNLERFADDYSPAELAQFTAAEIGDLVKLNEKHGQAILTVAKQFPATRTRTRLRPMSNTLLRVDIAVERNFDWNTTLHGHSEPLYVWLEDEQGINILQWAYITFKPSSTTIDLEFIVAIEPETKPPMTLRVISDRWVGCDESITIPLDDLIMPAVPPPTTTLLNIPLLPITALQDSSIQNAISSMFTNFNGIQSQAFWTIYHTDINVLLSAPNATGKSLLGQIACRHTSSTDSDRNVLYLCGKRSAARETLSRLNGFRSRVTAQLLLSDADFHTFAHAEGAIGVVDATALLGIAKHVADISSNLALVVGDDLHLLDDTYELALTQLLFNVRNSKTRVIGLTSSLDEPTDLAEWLGVADEGYYAFSTSNRAAPVVTTAHPFSIPHSATLLKSMVKPVYAAAKKGIARQTIVFVPSAGQCRSVANDLITQSGTEMDLSGFLQAPREDVEAMLYQLKNQDLAEAILHGIGVYYPGMSPVDAAIILELFASGIVPVLLASRETCWDLPVSAGTVVVMAAQYLEITASSQTAKDQGHHVERKLRNYSLQELVKMQGFAARPPATASQALKTGNASGQFYLMCQDEQVDAYLYFLDHGLPLESRLPEGLRADKPSMAYQTIVKLLGADPKRQDLMDLLSWSFLWRRMQSNPSYYDADQEGQAAALSRLVDEVFVKIHAKDKAAADQAKAAADKARREQKAVEAQEAASAAAIAVESTPDERPSASPEVDGTADDAGPTARGEGGDATSAVATGAPALGSNPVDRAPDEQPAKVDSAVKPNGQGKPSQRGRPNGHSASKPKSNGKVPPAKADAGVSAAVAAGW